MGREETFGEYLDGNTVERKASRAASAGFYWGCRTGLGQAT